MNIFGPFQMMSKEVKQLYSDNKTIMQYFKGCEEKFVNQFPRPALRKVEDAGLYTQFEKILTDPKPKQEYVTSHLITKSFFGMLRILPRKWSDVARMALMRLPK